ncbi:MAG: hypothetical protein ABSH16_01880 [Sedimentisphaerales bacterium]
MTRPHLIAKLILAAIGIRLFMWFISIASSPFIRLETRYPHEFLSMSFIITFAESLVLLAASMIFLFRSDGLMRMIVGPDADRCPKIDVCWVIASFRIMFCLSGLLMIYSCIMSLFYYIPTIFKGPILPYTTLQGQEALLSPKLLAGGFKSIVDCVIAIYLIFGAPHYIRWQLRKMLVKESNQISGVGKHE